MDSEIPPPSSLKGSAWERAREAHRIAGEARAIAVEERGLVREARDTTQRLETSIGRSPDPVLGVEGSGLLGTVAELRDTVGAIAAKVDKLVEGDPSRRRRRAAAGAAAAAAIVALGTAISAVVGAVRAPAPAPQAPPALVQGGH